MQPPRAVLVMRFSSVGDIVLTAPALAALAQAWPSTRILFATKAAFVPLVAAHPAIDAVISCAPQASLAQLRAQLAAYKAEAVCDLHGKMRGLALRLGLWPQRSVVWRKRTLGQSLSMRLGHGRYRAQKHIAERYHNAIEALVGRTLPRAPLRYYVAAADDDDAQALLERLAPLGQGPRIGISPGAMWATKRWPLERFIQLAQRLSAAGMQVLVTGSVTEKACAQALVEQVPQATDLSGALSLGVLGGVIGRCDVFVGNDSGPMHIARALGVPTLALFGSTDPHQFDARGHQLLWSARDCAPCSFHGHNHCPRGHSGCLKDIDVDLVYAHVRALLGTKPTAPVYG